MKPHFSFVLRSFFSGVLLIGTVLQAPAALAQSLQEFTLANGMRVIVKADPKAPTAVHMVWLRVGSMDDCKTKLV